MTTVQLTPEAAGLPGFDETLLARIGGAAEPALLQEKRAAAFAQYRELPMPQVRDEEWRRTDPALFPFDRFAPSPRLTPVPRALAASPWDEEFDVVVCVSDDGFSIHDRTGLLNSGSLVVLSLADAATRHPALVERYLQGAARVKAPRKFSALGDAFWTFGLFIHVAPRVVVPNGVLIRYQHRAAGKAVLPHLVAAVSDEAQLTIAEYYESPADAELLAVSTRELYAGRNATLRAASLQEWGARTYHIGEDWVRAERDARVEWVTLLLGGQVSKMMVSCDVHEPNAQAYLSGLFFANDNQHVDQRTLQLHSAPHTYSNLLYKGAVKDQGHSVYQGIIDAAPGAIKVDAYQMNKNLILNEGARADSLPGLEIDADDLKCSHGATMGNLDESQMFYLRSRGLPEAEARRLLVMAFFEEVIERVPHEFMRERVREDVRRKCGEGA
jgi:Fe-S cluster assembly protein SufD